MAQSNNNLPAQTTTVESKPINRSVADIEADLDSTRERLTATLGQLQTALQPANIAQRQMERVRDFYTDEYGAVRGDRVAATVGAVVALVVVRRAWRRFRA